MKYFLVITLLLFTFCTNNKQSTQVAIGDEHMKEILKERQLLISTFNTYQYEGAISEEGIDSMLSSTYLNLGYTDEEFQSSWEYYLNEGKDELFNIYGNVLQEFELMREESRK